MTQVRKNKQKNKLSQLTCAREVKKRNLKEGASKLQRESKISKNMDNVKEPTIKILTPNDENTSNQSRESFDKILEEETEKCTKIVTRNRQQLELPKKRK